MHDQDRSKDFKAFVFKNTRFLTSLNDPGRDRASFVFVLNDTIVNEHFGSFTKIMSISR